VLPLGVQLILAKGPACGFIFPMVVHVVVAILMGGNAAGCFFCWLSVEIKYTWHELHFSEQTRKNATVEYLDYQIPYHMRYLPRVDRFKRYGLVDRFKRYGRGKLFFGSVDRY